MRPNNQRRESSRIAIVALALLLPACSTPVEFSMSGANAPVSPGADDVNFDRMDQSIAQCKTAARGAGPGKCTQVRAYEACMKTKGYITVLGPENPGNCGQPAWEQDVRKWLE